MDPEAGDGALKGPMNDPRDDPMMFMNREQTADGPSSAARMFLGT